MSVRHLFQTLGLLITDAAVVVGTYFGMFYVPQLGMLLFLFGFPLIAFINSYFFHVIFKRYTPQEEQSVREEGTPLVGEEDEAMKEAIRNLKGK